jgi:hypothetical protein
MTQAFPDIKQKILGCLETNNKAQAVVKRIEKNLALGIGIMVGTAYTDFFGADWQKSYTALSPTVNYAKKLETLAAKPMDGRRKVAPILVAFGSGIDDVERSEQELREKLRSDSDLQVTEKTLSNLLGYDKHFEHHKAFCITPR